jgi:RHH-type transcriptional regulator, proline utilization regulon repressor / proline dehydrogenase / delta 1-pyrroline-5-carboxylate dehydrogenase
VNARKEASLEAGIAEIGARLYADAVRSRPPLFGARGMRGALLESALADAGLRNALFHFVDVLPQLESAEQIAAHFRSYLGGRELGGVWGRLLKLGCSPALAWAVRASVARTARLFLVEETPAAVKRALATLTDIGAAATVDAVGEAVLTEAEADEYVARYVRALAWQEAAGITPPHISLKLTALAPRFDPLDAEGTRQRVMARLAPLLREVLRVKASVTVDMEGYQLKSLILNIFMSIVAARPEPDWQPGIALQAYLPETERDLQELARFARDARRRIGVRLVKGAYWDTEVALARQHHWPVPVFLEKAETDAHYEHLTRMLFDAHDAFYPAIASHNLRTLAHALAAARAAGIERDEWEVQMLYGMAEPLARAAIAQGARLRVYVPTGDLVAGIAYLIRRLLENTAGASILRQTYAEGQPLDELLAAPASRAVRSSAAAPAAAFANTPLTDFSTDAARSAFAHALARVREAIGATYPLAIPGMSAPAAAESKAINPARPDEVLGLVSLADAAHADLAIENAVRAFPGWRDTPAAERAKRLQRAAGIILQRRHELAAWQVLEQAKNWREADADVAEAIDHLRYCAREMVQLDGWRETVSFPGATNHMRYEPRGVAAVIAPWNFPLAILAGMTGAALASGNCAIMKPAAPALIVAHRFHAILLEAGIPPEVCQLVPGPGASVGERLTRDARIGVIAFTGSREVGLRILELAAQLAPGQTQLKSVVCEMGGKNAIIVDEDADLDEAVVEIMRSAFGYQGQKCSACSRLIAVGGGHDRLVARLAAALDSHPLGPPEEPQYIFGPVISREAQRKAQAYMEIGATEGRLYYQGTAPADGFYVAPAIFTGIEPQHRLAREEIFGPILAVLRAASFEQALDIALDSEYALTGGVFSRLPEHLAAARSRFRVGNLYLNRRITGALVAAQPFGGVKLSGTGVQAGGPEYLKHFLWTRVVAENTMRHGFVP